MKKPQIKYPNRETKKIRITIGKLDLWFSYQTIIAFNTPETGLVVTKNTYSNTTGRHLNEIDGENKEDRLKRSKFEEKLKEVLQKSGLYK